MTWPDQKTGNDGLLEPVEAGRVMRAVNALARHPILAKLVIAGAFLGLGILSVWTSSRVRG